MAWAQRTEKARAVPETRYDQQLLNDTILSIKASFRHLEQSCTALERKVSKSRTMGSARRFVGLFWDGYDLNS
eukprot:g4511.t1